MILLSIDPGSRTGWAVFEDGRLSGCGMWTLESKRIEEECRELFEKSRRFSPDRVVAELPRIYPMRRSKGDPNDLIPLACLAAAAALAGKTPGELVSPHAWKGTIPKPSRGRWREYIVHKRILETLYEEERQVYVAQAPRGGLDMIDAVGLGLWNLRRP